MGKCGGGEEDGKNKGEMVGGRPGDGDDKMVEELGRYGEKEAGKSEDEIVGKRPDGGAGKEDEIGKGVGGENDESREEIGGKSLVEGEGKCVDREAGIWGRLPLWSWQMHFLTKMLPDLSIMVLLN